MNKKGIIPVIKGFRVFAFVTLILTVSSLFSQESKVRVIVNRAPVYAEASTESYRIETLKEGMVLVLFGEKQTDKNWYYVYYQSPRWKSKVIGFVQAEMVARIDAPEIKKSAPQLEQPEAKEESIQIERVPVPTSLPVNKGFMFPLSYPSERYPRMFESQEPPKPEGAVIEEELETGILPRGADRVVQQKDKIDTKIWKKEVVIPETTEVPEKERDVKDASQPLETKKPPGQEQQITVQKPPKITRSKPPQDKPLFTLSIGYGPSLGGFGGFIQLNTSANISVHWGVGYYPTAVFYPDYDWVEGRAMYSVGIKYYLPWSTNQVRPYIDFQYGGISVEAVRVVTGIWYYTYIYDDIQKTLWGPSFLAGLELRLGHVGLNAAVGVSYVATKWEYWDQPVFVTADIGFLVFF